MQCVMLDVPLGAQPLPTQESQGLYPNISLMMHCVPQLEIATYCFALQSWAE
jgi:hypothetical protein